LLDWEALAARVSPERAGRGGGGVDDRVPVELDPLSWWVSWGPQVWRVLARAARATDR
jgi:hypothetical protein